MKRARTERLGRFRAAATLLGAAALLQGLAPPGVSAQPQSLPPQVVGAAVEARIDVPGGGTEVEIRYRLRAHGASMVPLRALEFFGVAILDLEAHDTGTGEPLEVGIETSESGSLTGTLRMPQAADASSETAVTLTYTLHGAIPGGAAAFDATVPLVMVDWAPEGSREELFTAHLFLPEQYSVVETFPMVPRESEGERDERAYRLTLPVVPSMVRFRGRLGDPPLFTLGRSIDAGVLALLLALSALGWRALRRAETEERRLGAIERGEAR